MGLQTTDRQATGVVRDPTCKDKHNSQYYLQVSMNQPLFYGGDTNRLGRMSARSVQKHRHESICSLDLRCVHGKIATVSDERRLWCTRVVGV